MSESSRPRPRIVPRGGEPLLIRRIGLRESPIADLYHVLLHQRWSMLFCLALGFYTLINAIFAFAYLHVGGIAGLEDGAFWDAFAFSVQTLTTIGYGAMAPVAGGAHLLVTLQAFMGLLAFALITGLVFAKFSRPRARVMFSERAVVTLQDGEPCFMFRMANERLRSRIVEAELRVTLMRDETTREGVFMRRFYDMPLVRSRSPVFALSWTAMHPIDTHSPLAGYSPARMQAENVEVVVSFVGIDETMSQTLHGRFSYVAEEVVFGARFHDVLRDDGQGRVFDYQRFHDVVPCDDDLLEVIAQGRPRV